MGDLETLKALLARVQASGGPDCDLDRAIAVAFPPLGGWCDEDIVPPCSASLDAAVHLVGRALPGWSLEFRLSGFGTPAQAALHDPMQQPAPGYDTRVDHPAGVPALAICAALLTALLAQAEAPSTSAGGKTDA